MLYYCPQCWHEIEADQDTCPICGRLVSSGTDDLVTKYIAAIRHPEPTRATLAIHVLGEMLHEPRAIAPLSTLLRTATNTYIVAAAVQALGQLGASQAVPALGDLLLAPETRLIVRMAIVTALHRIGGAEALALLRLAVADSSACVRASAREYLSENS